MSNSLLLHSFLLCLFMFSFASSSSSSFSNNTHKCSPKQSLALLHFKQNLSSINNSFYDSTCQDWLGSSYYPIMMNWNTNVDCCSWDGVTCNYFTGDVIGLDLSCGMLKGIIHPNTTLFHLPHLQRLNLAFNDFYPSHLPHEIGSLANSLTNLNISRCGFEGEIPFSIGQLKSLNRLIISNCSLTGPIPKSIGNLRNLTFLDLRSNMLNGTLPSSLFTISSLEFILLRNNTFSGSIPLELDTLLSSLTKLVALSLSYSGLSVVTTSVNRYINPYFYILGLASCKLTAFPKSIKAMKNLWYLDLSSNEIHGHIPNWIGEIGGNQLSYLYLRSNKLQGPFPPSICNMSRLYVLDMSNNSFDGVLPQCFGNFSPSLRMANLGNNHLNGTIPDVFEVCGELEGIILNGNELEGEVPSSLSKCQSLKVVDMGNNHLNGAFPVWLGGLPQMQVLVLNSNKLHGPIECSTTTKLPFPSLKVLDLSHNGFVGHLPENYFQNFRAMKNVVKKATKPEYMHFGVDYYSITLCVKDQQLLFTKFFVDYTTIDLSNNRFEGEIPRVVGSLNSLKVLNLSHNSLTGQIPHSLGNLIEIESLDLSWNQLIGEIPQSLADITNLEVLNLSQNHLIGRIPERKQFSTFENSFGGNPGLCGISLPKKCERPQESQLKTDGDTESGFMWKVVTLGYGCGTVLGLVMGYLMLTTRRPKWFNAISDTGEHMIRRRRNKRRYVYVGK